MSALRRAGVVPRQRVGIFRRKDIGTVASIYGVLKAHCAYVPLDTKMGSDRLGAVLDDAGLAALIVDPALAPKICRLAISGLEPVLREASLGLDLWAFTRNAGAAPLNHGVPSSGGGLAYILYTSGSTGIPKGVQHTHASAIAFASWAAKEFDISSDDRLSCHAPLHFDLTIFDLFAAAMKGACIVLIPDDIAMFPLRVASLLETEKLTVWYSVPFALIQLAERGNLANRSLALRQVIFAGERFPPVQLRHLASQLPGARLSNLFGPTETNVCTHHHLSPDDIQSNQFCPIGLPCPYSEVAIVDPSGNNVQPGDMGELLVGGSSVMTGYLNRPQLNREVFVTRTEAGKTKRFFRTGDLVTAPSAGPIYFHGRADRQVKVRGFRIELDEIESTLEGCAGVVAAAAWVAGDGNGLAEIRAAVARNPASTSLTSDHLILQIRPHLNQAAIPSQVLVLDDLPRNDNGKVDYSVLARWDY